MIGVGLFFFPQAKNLAGKKQTMAGAPLVYRSMLYHAACESEISLRGKLRAHPSSPGGFFALVSPMLYRYFLFLFYFSTFFPREINPKEIIKWTICRFRILVNRLSVQYESPNILLSRSCTTNIVASVNHTLPYGCNQCQFFSHII